MLDYDIPITLISSISLYHITSTMGFLISVTYSLSFDLNEYHHLI